MLLFSASANLDQKIKDGQKFRKVCKFIVHINYTYIYIYIYIYIYNIVYIYYTYLLNII